MKRWRKGDLDLSRRLGRKTDSHVTSYLIAADWRIHLVAREIACLLACRELGVDMVNWHILDTIEDVASGYCVLNASISGN
jgi:hypothetical protein